MYPKKCAGCGEQFITPNFQQRRCSPTCGRDKNPTRSIERTIHHLDFVGIDGEGVTRPDGKHEYIMLSIGTRTLMDAGRELSSFPVIMQFIWDYHVDFPNAVMVGFFLGYDFTMWEKLLPQHIADLLLTDKGIEKRKTANRKSKRYRLPDPVVYAGWEFDTLRNRRWKMRPHRHERSRFNDYCRNMTCDYEFTTLPDEVVIREGELEWEPPGPGEYGREDVTWRSFPHAYESPEPAYLVICDTGPFWQTGFVNVIDPANWEDHPVCTAEVYQLIRDGKRDRKVVREYGDTSFLEEMATYNVMENAVLATVTTRLNRGFSDSVAGIRLDADDWYGPGRAAQSYLYKVSKRTSVMSEDLPISDEMRLACQESYYGGWFEIPMHGHIGTGHEYDICSAYPSIIRNLPCLLHGTWRQGEGSNYPVSPFTLIRAHYRGSNPYIGGMPHRNVAGNICRPHASGGWYWLGEVIKSAEAGLIDDIVIDEWVSYDPCSCPSPFADSVLGIERLYAERMSVGKNTAQGKALKLLYNSVYGKMAQSVGNPKFGNPFYASFITSGTRTMILHAIATHPVGAADVAMIATDGIYFRTEHPGLITGERLGDWEHHVKPGLTLMMPGVYWDDVTREVIRDVSTPPEDKRYRMKSRGVSARDVAKVLFKLDDQWREFHTSFRRGWPKIKLAVDFHMTSGKAALSQGDWSRAGWVQHGTTRLLSADPVSKRMPYPIRDGEIIRTPVKPVGHAPESVPYSKSFGWPDMAELEGLNDEHDVMRDFDTWADLFGNGVAPV